MLHLKYRIAVGLFLISISLLCCGCDVYKTESDINVINIKNNVSSYSKEQGYNIEINNLTEKGFLLKSKKNNKEIDIELKR